MFILPIDELNILTAGLGAYFEDDPETGKRRIRSEKAKEDIIDELLDLFLLSYASGAAAANADLNASVRPGADDAEAAIYKNVAGKNFLERVNDYFRDGGTEYDIERIAETDMTRIYNTAVLDVGNAVQSGNTSTNVLKVWNTMMDDRVRDTHDYLEKVAVPLGAEFVTFDGDHALAPGLFSKPENNINCRCTITLRRG